MNVIQTGNIFRFFDEDDITCTKQLPPGFYEVGFSRGSGFFLSEVSNFASKEQKIYGRTQNKIDKVVESYKRSDRNLGVILSGIKGTGKSIFAMKLAEKCFENGIPVILVNSMFQSIAPFISSIDQRCMVLFDEFEKTYANDVSSDGEEMNRGPQDELLTLFDGVDGGQKLYVITVNNVSKLNDCFINRPGRFLYHFEISPPKTDEVEEYIRDKMNPEYIEDTLERIKELSMITPLTYDCLRAIVREINLGFSLTETLEDINLHIDQCPEYLVRIVDENDVVYERAVDIDILDKADYADFYGKNYEIKMALEVRIPSYSIAIKDELIYADPDKIGPALLYETDSYGRRRTEDGVEVKLKSVTLEQLRKTDYQKYTI